MPGELLTEVVPELASAVRAPEGAWWARYRELGFASMSHAAQRVLSADSAEIAASVWCPDTSSSQWPSSRVRTGMVVGAVQSGKTASMLALTALLLDAGVNVLVLLSGTRISLWRQTYDRLLRQLDGIQNADFRDRWKARVVVPDPEAVLMADSRMSPREYLASAEQTMRDALERGRPCVLVLPKIDAHLLAASRRLETTLRSVVRDGRRFQMVVIDDEADDASVLDAVDSKTIPRRIEMLWAGSKPGSTPLDGLYATYVAYTATPQANFLQRAHNPLAPRDFCLALRTPYRTGAFTPKSVTYEEPLGVAGYYCGGDLFYGDTPLRGVASLVLSPAEVAPEANGTGPAETDSARTDSDRMLKAGLRAFFVASALRLMKAVSSGSLLPSALKSPLASSELGRLPPICSMLVHPSARQDDHYDEARRLVELFGMGEHTSRSNEFALEFDPNQLELDLATNESLWRMWLDRYRQSRSLLLTWPGANELYVPPISDWPQVAKMLRDEIFRSVAIRIINSDPDNDESPQFSIRTDESGRQYAPRDLLTIFVAGNVMSRGLTLEGLTTTVFTRSSDEPAADTQMQMQRWFGYRGRYLHLCRVFAFQDQIELFQTYHRNDVAMRTEILSSSARPSERSPLVLQGPRSLATAKIPTSKLPLHPGPNPTVRLVECDDVECAAANADLLAALLDEGDWVAIGPEDKPRGRVRREAISMEVVAALLDQFRYAAYAPGGLTDTRYTRWQSLADHLGGACDDGPFFRAPARASSILLDPRTCPYSIAAYLRLWTVAHASSKPLALFNFAGDPWLFARKPGSLPKFYVGVAFGDSGPPSFAKLAERGVRAMARGETGARPRMLQTLWGRRGDSGAYYADQFFDYNLTGLTPPALLGGEEPWRPEGHPGLLLFHVVRVQGAPCDAVTVGVGIPKGGPEQFAAIGTPDARRKQ